MATEAVLVICVMGQSYPADWVVDGGKVVGVVAQADVARELDEGTTGEVVEEISQ